MPIARVPKRSRKDEGVMKTELRVNLLRKQHNYARRSHIMALVIDRLYSF